MEFVLGPDGLIDQVEYVEATIVEAGQETQHLANGGIVERVWTQDAAWGDLSLVGFLCHDDACYDGVWQIPERAGYDEQLQGQCGKVGYGKVNFQTSFTLTHLPVGHLSSYQKATDRLDGGCSRLVLVG
jgi:hypothetical protein